MISFWERESFTRYDYIIIGSGITGLSVAATLLERQAQARVLVLERGIFPTGASTKNAGFACIGSPTELLADLRTMPSESVTALVALRYKGLRLLRQRLGDAAIGYTEQGSYELLSEPQLYCLPELARLNELLFPVVQTTAFVLRDEIIGQYGFDANYFRAAVTNCCEGQLDTGLMMRALLQYVQRLGATVVNGAEVLGWTDTGTGVEVRVQHTALRQEVTFWAQRVAICTNAFARQLLPDIDLRPGRGQVLATHPIANLPFKGIFHFDEGYYYFRSHAGRVIFGGGRNLDFATETSTEFAYNELILADLTEKLHRYILPHTPFEIDMRWTGIMGFGSTKQPHLLLHSPNVAVGVKLSGMGVAIGSELGRQVAELLIY